MKVGGVALLTTLIAIVLSLTLSTWRDTRTGRRVLAQARTADAEMLTANLSVPLVFGDRASARVVLDSASRIPSVTDAYVLDKKGALFVGHGPHNAERLVAAAESRETANRLETRAPIMFEQDRVGELVLISSLHDLNRALVVDSLVSILISLVAMAIALVAGLRLTELVVGPIRRLSAACANVRTAGDFSERVKRTSSDELGVLADEFNALFTTLGENDVILRENMLELTKARDDAEAASVAKSQFLANMSHEVRTPLNGVLGMVHVMEASPVNPIQRDQLATIRQSGEALLQVLNDILDLSKIEAGKLDVRPARFGLEDLVNAIRGVFAESAAAKDLQWTCNVADDAKGQWFGDAIRLRQILTNLLSNGLKFTERGGVSLAITTTDTGLSFSVTDTGIGLTPDQLSQLFNKFTQVDSSSTRRAGGTGLGLVISRQLAELLGGTILVASELGVGSTFTLRVPLARLEQVAVAVPAQAPTRFPQADDEAEIRVLAAEDNAVNRRVLAALLAPLGVELTMVDNGELAVQSWLRGNFDLILMDIQMPVMGGVEATQRIRAIESERCLAPIPIIAVSANAMNHQIAEYAAAGMTGFVSKPIEPAALFHAISEAAQAKTARVSHEAPERREGLKAQPRRRSRR